MKIKLLKDLPLEKKHGAFKDSVFEVIEKERRRGSKVFFIGNAGEECATFSYEYEVVEREVEKK